LTSINILYYIEIMEAELTSLENKITQFIEVNEHLREETLKLRQEIASISQRNKQLEERITLASSRLERIVEQLPEENT
jgi:predicted  nucleic acid-binding Zn-ribbon protein